MVVVFYTGVQPQVLGGGGDLSPHDPSAKKQKFKKSPCKFFINLLIFCN